MPRWLVPLLDQPVDLVGRAYLRRSRKRRDRPVRSLSRSCGRRSRGASSLSNRASDPLLARSGDPSAAGNFATGNGGRRELQFRQECRIARVVPDRLQQRFAQNEHRAVLLDSFKCLPRSFVISGNHIGGCQYHPFRYMVSITSSASSLWIDGSAAFPICEARAST